MIRRVFGGLLAVATVLPAAAQQWPEIELVERYQGFDRPVQMVHAGDGSGRFYVVEQRGLVWRIDGDDVAVFLDLRDRISCCSERGLLSIAFPPGIGVKHYFYANYTDVFGDTVVSRFQVLGGETADPETEQEILAIPQPFSNHNGGQLAFGPDGYLYIGTGDGGSGGDPLNAAQNPESLLGKMLRIDVESGSEPYAVPIDNPFVDNPAFEPEIWALGLRNPWRFSFDAVTGGLYIADVGQNLIEEVDFQPSSSAGGENYGWRILEGGQCFNPDPCDSSETVLPVAEYSHTLGCSVSGGHVYRGGAWPALRGVYFYGDFCSGRIWGLRRSDGDWQSTQLMDSAASISAFGRDQAGALYVVDYLSGSLFELVDADQPVPFRMVPSPSD